jgi:lysophospholipase L1-like esterase
MHGNVGHSLGHVVGDIEGLPNGQRVEHVAKAKVDMISVSYGANDIGPKDFLPFLELGHEFIKFHSIWVLIDLISRTGSPSVGCPNEEVVTKYIFGHKRGVIRMEAVIEYVKG